jgi:hypothetical protein
MNKKKNPQHNFKPNWMDTAQKEPAAVTMGKENTSSLKHITFTIEDGQLD